MSLRRLITTSAALISMAVLAGQAQAEIVLRAETSDYCEIEVSVGSDAPNALVQRYGDITLPWEQIFEADKVCFRHSVEADCDAFAEWRCCEATEDQQTLCTID